MGGPPWPPPNANTSNAWAGAATEGRPYRRLRFSTSSARASCEPLKTPRSHDARVTRSGGPQGTRSESPLRATRRTRGPDKVHNLVLPAPPALTRFIRTRGLDRDRRTSLLSLRAGSVHKTKRKSALCLYQSVNRLDKEIRVRKIVPILQPSDQSIADLVLAGDREVLH